MAGFLTIVAALALSQAGPAPSPAVEEAKEDGATAAEAAEAPPEAKVPAAVSPAAPGPSPAPSPRQRALTSPRRGGEGERASSPPSAPGAFVPPPPAAPAPPPASAPPPAPPARRSDPAEARARRQRLLQRAMQNMGVGPFAARPSRSSAPGEAAPAAGGREAAPPEGSDAALRKALLAVAPRAREASLFARLGLDETASRDEVKQAYLALARQFHPDRFAGGALRDLHETVKDFFTAVNEAYETLSDDRKRAEYVEAKKGISKERSEGGRVDFQKAEACLRTRDFARARGFYESAIRADPRPEYQAALAYLLLVDPQGRDRERARALLDDATKDARCDRAMYAAGILARDEGDDPRAERMFRAALQANPRHAEAVRELRLLQTRRAQGRR